MAVTCYLLQTHNNPEQIYRLVNVIISSSSRPFILICHDRRFCELDVKRFEKFAQVQIIWAEGGRGDFKIVQSYLDAVEWLFKNKVDFDWLINLSGQDYPTQALSHLEKQLDSSPYDGYMEYFSVDKTYLWTDFTGQDRYFYQYWKVIKNLNLVSRGLLSPIKTLINASQSWFRLNLSYGLMLGLKARSTPFTDTFKCYGGSFFKTLSQACVEYLYNYSINHPELVNYYKRTVIPDESYIQTVLVNSNVFNFYNNNQVYVDFSRSLRHGRPRILTREDYDSLLSDDIFFARKFDPTIDLDILDQLDHRIFMRYSSREAD